MKPTLMNQFREDILHKLYKLKKILHTENISSTNFFFLLWKSKHKYLFCLLRTKPCICLSQKSIQQEDQLTVLFHKQINRCTIYSCIIFLLIYVCLWIYLQLTAMSISLSVLSSQYTLWFSECMQSHHVIYDNVFSVLVQMYWV